MEVFVSYARADAAAVRGLADDIELGDHQVWFDRDLHGGDDWWRRILERIRECPVMVFALSEHSLRSQVCRAELDYAETLGVPVVPIQVGAVESVATSRVARYHVIDGREQGSALGYRVMAALARGAARRGPLPDPLPPDPEVPFAHLAAIGRQIDGSQLRSTEQAAIIGQLRYTLRAEADDDARAGARRLLIALRAHPECTWSNAEEIDTILNGFGSAHPQLTESVYARPPSIVGVPIALSGAAFVAVSPDGERVYVTNAGSGPGTGLVSVVDAGSGAVLASPIPVGERPYGVATSSDGRRVYVANNGSGSISVVNAGSGAVVRAPDPAGEGPFGVAVSPDGRRVYVANAGSGSVSVVNAWWGGVEGSPIPVGEKPVGVAVSPDGRRVYVANNGSDSVSVVDTRSGAVVGSPIPVGEKPFGVAVSPDGQQVFVANDRSGSVSVVDTWSGSVVGSPIPVGEKPVCLVVSPDGRRVYVANNGAGSVAVVDTRSGAVVGAPIPVGEKPLGLAVSPDGRRVYVANRGDSTLSVIDTGLR